MDKVFERIAEVFPFVVLFSALPTKILVVAIAHTSRDPGYWTKR